MNPFTVSKESAIYRWVDGAVVLIIGMVLGIVISQGIAFFEMGTTTTTEVLRRVPLQKSETKESGTVTAPDDFIPFEDI
jgi:hypothetical protein